MTTSILGYKKQEYPQRIYYNEYPIEFISSSKQSYIQINGKRFTTVTDLIEEIPDIKGNLTLMAKTINHLAQQEKFSYIENGSALIRSRSEEQYAPEGLYGEFDLEEIKPPVVVGDNNTIIFFAVEKRNKTPYRVTHCCGSSLTTYELLNRTY